MNPLTWLRRLRPKLLDLWRRGRRRIHPLLDRAKAKLWLFAGIVLIAVILWSIDHYRDWLTNDLWIWLGTTPDGRVESNSATLRNVGLVIAAVVALPLAIWRSKVAERQADTAQRGLLNERYQTGAEMLGSNVLSVRLGGIYALQRLADEHPEQYHVQIMRLFCAFVRNPTMSGERKHASEVTREPPHTVPSLHEDIQAVVRVIGTRRKEFLDLEGKARFHLDMRGSDLRGVEALGMNLTTSRRRDSTEESISEAFTRRTNLSDSKLCSAKMAFAKLKDADLMDSCMCNTWLAHADLTDAYLMGADLSDATFFGAHLSGASLSASGHHPVTGLTQAQLDQAFADPDSPPSLTGVLDAKTGQPLVWRGAPPPDKP